MMNLVYRLRICEPGSKDDYLRSFDSQQPFLPIHGGDLLNGGMLEGATLRVTGLEHLITETAHQLTHTLLVYTEGA